MMDDVCQRLRALGVKVADYELPAPFADILQRHRAVMAVGAAQFHGERLRRHPDDYMPKIRGLIEEGLACPTEYYDECIELQPKSAYQADYPWSAKEILLTPATASAAPEKETTGDPVFNSPWSYTGLPTVSLPTGHFDKGLPLAIQLVGAAGDEARLFSAAAWVEKALNVNPLTPPLS
jgi:aspartyl-tRNA(Asn)/glutamyl-tRNA(Gln) amidotransferase subunit A